MRRSLAILAALSVLCMSPAALATEIVLDYAECQQQFEALLRTDVDCAAKVGVKEAALQAAPEMLRPLLAGTQCRLALRFKKSSVYGQWIKEDAVEIPSVPIACTLSSGGVSDEFSGSLGLKCSRTGEIWNCSPALNEVKGLGVLGRVLESYVSGNVQLQSAIAEAMKRLEDH